VMKNLKNLGGARLLGHPVEVSATPLLRHWLIIIGLNTVE